MWRVFQSSWSLLLAMFLLMASNGMLVTLLSLRGNMEGMTNTALGFLHAAYPLGQLLGCILAPRLVMKVGHIRVFAAAASLASTAALIHMVFIDVNIWAAMRFLSGLCYASLYIVVEGWLNEQIENRYRAQLFSIYAIIMYLGIAFGQYLLSIGDSGGIGLFVLISVFISISIVPVLIAGDSSPAVNMPQSVSIMSLLKQSPTALSGAFLIGILYMLYFVNSILYLTEIGIAESDISIIIAWGSIGTLLFQFPIARLSDHRDRRKIIVGICLITLPVIAFIPLIAGNNIIYLYIGFFLLGGLIFPIYSLCAALLNDRLKPSQMVAATGTFVFVLNLGQIFGPASASLIMEKFGVTSVFWIFAVTLIVLATISMIRQKQHSVNINEQEPALDIQAITPTIASQFTEQETK